MTWAYTTNDGTTVDLFVPKTDIPGFDYEVGEEMPAEPPSQTTAQATYMDSSPAPSSARTGAPDSVDDEPPDAGPLRTSSTHRRHDVVGPFDRTSPDDLARIVQGPIRQIEEQLFVTAPEAPVRVAGHTVHGSWTPLDAVGPSTGSLLFALLDEPLSRHDSWEVARTLRSRMSNRIGQMASIGQAYTRFTAPAVTSQGRLLVAITGEDVSQPWDLIADDPY